MQLQIETLTLSPFCGAAILASAPTSLFSPDSLTSGDLKLAEQAAAAPSLANDEEAPSVRGLRRPVASQALSTPCSKYDVLVSSLRAS